MKSLLIKILSLGILLSMSAASQEISAYDWVIETHIVNLEPTYMPTQILFNGDVTVSTCPAGGRFAWIAKGTTADEKRSNVEAVYATLMTAQASGRRVTLYGVNANCSVDYIHLLDH